jgi:hypothetical protein
MCLQWIGVSVTLKRALNDRIERIASLFHLFPSPLPPLTLKNHEIESMHIIITRSITTQHECAGGRGETVGLVWWTLEGNIWQSVLKQQPKRRKKHWRAIPHDKISLHSREVVGNGTWYFVFCFVLIGFGSCNQYNTKCIYHFLSRHLIYK